MCRSCETVVHMHLFAEVPMIFFCMTVLFLLCAVSDAES